MPEMSPEQDEYWAAGYFDARGGYHFRSSQVMIMITDQDLEVLERFRRIVGHGRIRPVKNGKSNMLQIGAGGAIRDITRRFRPLVTRSKLLAQMEQALADERVLRAPSPAGRVPSGA